MERLPNELGSRCGYSDIVPPCEEPPEEYTAGAGDELAVTRTIDDVRQRHDGNSPRGFRPATLLVLVAGVIASPRFAVALPTGIAAAGCDGCHNGGKVPQVTLTASPVAPALGETVTLTVTVTQTNGPIAGFFLTTEGVENGMFRMAEPGTLANANGVTHTMPRTGSGGLTTFKALWSSAVPTGVQFAVYALSANGDGTNRGDGAGSTRLSIASGCAGVTYYLDQDGDGFGTSDPAFPIRKDCAQPPSYASQGDDCNDFNATIFPGAPEMCDGKDNNCDGKIDEAVVNRTYCEDKDGDGHGIVGGATKVDCAPSAGFGDCGGDCDDRNPMVYPGAPEICDGRDNNCNGSFDEGVRMTCGTGWCRRYAVGCSAVCTPGPPIAETCNYFDDDCDGVIDNGTDAQLCGGVGQICVLGNCIPGMSIGDGGSGQAGSPGVGSGGSAGSSGMAVTTEKGGCSAAPVPPTSDLGVVLAFWGLVVASVRRGQRGSWASRKATRVTSTPRPDPLPPLASCS